MRALLSWALSLCFVACVAQPVPGAPDEAMVELASGQAALALGDCSPDAIGDATTWSRPDATDEVCDGRFTYQRHRTCVAPDPSCGQTCVRHETCRDWSFGTDSQRQTVQSSSTLTVPGICRTLCNGRVGGSCEEPQVLCMAPAAGTLTARCSEAAEAYRRAHYNTAPTVGTVASSSALPANFTRIGETRNYHGPCSFSLAVPQAAARAAAPCACASLGNASCRVTGPACGTERTTTNPGLTRTQAAAVVTADPIAAPLVPRRGAVGADLSCTTCEDLPLPLEAWRYDDEAQPAVRDRVQAKYACLSTRLAPLPEAQRLPVYRNLLLLYEAWGEFLDDSPTEAYDAYQHLRSMRDLTCGPAVTFIDLPAACGDPAASLSASLVRCQRILEGAHITPELRYKPYRDCGGAMAVYRRQVGRDAACNTPAFEALLTETAKEILPVWPKAALGRPSAQPEVDDQTQVTDTLIGSVPPGYTCPRPEDDSGWSGGFLFGPRHLADQPLGSEGQLFCRYDYVGPGAGLHYGTLPIQGIPCGEPGVSCASKKHLGSEWLKPDLAGLTEQAPGDLPVDFAARLRVEYLNAMDTPLTLAGAPRRPVDLVILDGLPFSEAHTIPVAGEGHGRALAVAAFRTACPGGQDCPVAFRSYQAFRPGSQATLSELAVQIVRAVDDAEARGSKAVLNVSLGLHPGLAYWDRPNDTTYPNGVLLPAFAALKAALNYASARGVIVVAASGNSDGADVQEDEGDRIDRGGELLYPAAFDGVQGWQCDAKRHCEDAPARTLLVAASGVTADNRPLANARLGQSDVPFVAAGCNVVLDNRVDGSEAELPTYCGSSFGALGVSAVLAASWAYIEDERPEALFALLRATGTNTSGRVRPTCTGSNCRVNMCRALASAGAQVTCGRREVPAIVPATAAAFASQYGRSVVWQGANSHDDRDEACDTDLLYEHEHNLESCPLRRYETELVKSEILTDQPPTGRCPTCVVVVLGGDPPEEEESTAFLMGKLEPSTEEVTSPTLTFDGRTYELGSVLAPLLTHGGSFAIPLKAQPANQSSGNVAAFSFLKKQTGTDTVTAQVDPLPVLR